MDSTGTGDGPMAAFFKPASVD